MKEVTQYQCEHCGALFNNADECGECEDFHIPVASIVRYKYYSKAMGPESKYPYAVVIEMEDGKQLTLGR